MVRPSSAHIPHTPCTSPVPPLYHMSHPLQIAYRATEAESAVWRFQTRTGIPLSVMCAIYRHTAKVVEEREFY